MPSSIERNKKTCNNKNEAALAVKKHKNKDWGAKLMAKKTYVLDTNIILHNPNALLMFEDNDIVIPDVVIDELDKHKRDNGEVGANARAASRMLDSFRNKPENGDILSGYKLENGGTLRVEMNHIDVVMPQSWKETPDLRILRVCKGVKQEKALEPDERVILVSNDGFMRIKASMLGLEAQDYTTEKAPALDDIYPGRREAFALGKDIDDFYKNGEMSESALTYYNQDGKEAEMPPLTLHEYVLVKALENPSKSMIGIFDGKKILPLVNDKASPFGITPKNVGQRYIADALSRPASEAPLVIVKGPAGTGKTLVALAVGLEAVMEKGEYKRILYLRSNVKLDEDIGFLPGTEQEKLDWALRPVRDNLEVIFSASDDKEPAKPSKASRRANPMGSDYDKDFLTRDVELKDMIEEIFQRGFINIEAVGYMRGRSVANTFVIIDEAQNLTPKQIKTLLSRCAADTKIVLLGDPNQIDAPFLDSRTNGLCYAADRMQGSETTYQLSMIESECERSELSMEISRRMN